MNKGYGGDKYKPKEGLSEGVPECEAIGHVADHDTKGRSEKPNTPKKKVKSDRGKFTIC